ncbi:MAG: hypothetical protein HC817_01625 [Saprospiraceae bacterium]|nr:hypothetical protein [Saprospiraceae bacterium]
MSNGKTAQITVNDLPEAQILRGSWQVNFKEILGYGGKHIFENLTDWKDHPNDSIKHYAGTATYKKSFNFNQNLKKQDTRITLDLGQVAVAAQVKLNGKDLGVLWKMPFTIDVTEALKNGQNDLEIAVTNLWTNRLIGDERYPDNSGYKFGNDPFAKDNTKFDMPDWYVKNQPVPSGQRKTFTTANFYKATDDLVPSGLLGDVVLRFSKVVAVKY